MRIRKHLRSPAFVSTRSDPPAAPAVETSFHNALISNTLCNPTPNTVIRNLPSSNHIAENIAGLTRLNDKDSDSIELMQTPIANKEEEIGKPRVCTLNKSPWDDPAFVQGFFTKPTIEPADDQSIQNCRRTMKKLRRSNLASDTKAILAEAKQEVRRNLPSSNHIVANIAGVTKLNDKDSDSVELMQTPIANKVEEEIEKPRVCTLNKSPWDDPAFVQGFFTKPTIEPADDQSMQNCGGTMKKRRRSNLASDTEATAEAKQQPQVHVEDKENDFNKTDISRHARNHRAEMIKNGHGKEVLHVPEAEQVLESAPTNIKTNAIAYGKEVLQVAENKEQVLESALRRVFSEEVSLTVREAGCKLNMLGNVNNITSEGLPLSVQVKRTLLNSPYFVKMDDGQFALWNNFLNSKVGRQDEEKISGSKIEKRMRLHKFDTEENCATYKEPAKELGQSETKLEHALPKTIPTKGKRSRRAGLVMNMKQHEVKEEIDICKEADGKRRNSSEQEFEERSYNSL